MQIPFPEHLNVVIILCDVYQKFSHYILSTCFTHIGFFPTFSNTVVVSVEVQCTSCLQISAASSTAFPSFISPQFDLYLLCKCHCV
jgi:hypothetical protein